MPTFVSAWNSDTNTHFYEMKSEQQHFQIESQIDDLRNHGPEYLEGGQGDLSEFTTAIQNCIEQIREKKEEVSIVTIYWSLN